ncbi:MAG: hypothetical protein VXZ27_03545, partial [SAR324 cluster bacterium]|nr:hypothetical protein [SAR324 cluster bacterium]
MFLYFETQPTVGPRRFCRLAWGQQVRRGLQQWRLSVQTGKVGTNHYSKDNWFKSADALHSKIKIIEEENIIKTNLNFDFSKINLDEMAEKFQKNILKLKKLISLGDLFQANL